MSGKNRFEPHRIDGKRIRVVESETGREEGVWNYEMGEWFESEREQVDLDVEPAHAWQELVCPACDGSFNELIKEDSKLCVIFCPECSVRINLVYDRDRGGQTKDDTEQTTLVPDGGRCKTPYLSTDRD